jgi:hercynylcysteine S-oxide lyase
MTASESDLAALDVRTSDGVRFGRELKEEFLFGKGFLQLNHGEFG